MIFLNMPVVKVDNNNKYYPTNSNNRYIYIDTDELFYPESRYVVLDKDERRIYRNIMSNKTILPSSNSIYIGYKNIDGKYVWCNKETYINCDINEKYSKWFDYIISEVIII